VSRICGIVQSNDELVDASQQLGFSWEVFLAGTPLRDPDLILSQVEVALKDAERSKNALGPASLQGAVIAHCSGTRSGVYSFSAARKAVTASSNPVCTGNGVAQASRGSTGTA
jgi:hypothetical protein